MYLVIYTPRTGSRYFSTQLAEKHNYKNLGEIFSPRTYPNLSDRQLNQQIVDTTNDIVIKVGLWQIGSDRISSLIEKSEKTYVCWRRNFNDQAKSLYAALDPSVNNFSTEILSADIKYDELIFHRRSVWLKTQYRKLASFLETVESEKIELVDYESFSTPEKRYKRTFIWDIEPPLTNFSTEYIFSYFHDVKFKNNLPVQIQNVCIN